MIDFERLIGALADASTQFIVVGGFAATAHGATRLTQDLDVVYRRSPDNFVRLESALSPLGPYLRGAPPGLPFTLDARTLASGVNFTLTTAAGDLDLLGEITGGGRYEDLEPHTVAIEVFGRRLLCLDLETLIRVKRAAGRPKDWDALGELEALHRERD